MPAFTKPMAGRGTSGDGYKAALGRYIRDLRTAAGMTQADLAKALDITYYTSISAIEVGRNVVPPERYLAFAEALGVPPAEFAQRVCELTNPWMAIMLFSTNVKKDMAKLTEELDSRLGREARDPRFRPVK